MARDITPRQKKFVQEYLQSGDATDAAIAAGYSAKSAASTASKTLKMPGVIEYRRELEKKLFDEMAESAKLGAGVRTVLVAQAGGKPTLLAVDAGRKLLHLASKPTFANLDAWVNAMLEQE